MIEHTRDFVQSQEDFDLQLQMWEGEGGYVPDPPNEDGAGMISEDLPLYRHEHDGRIHLKEDQS